MLAVERSAGEDNPATLWMCCGGLCFFLLFSCVIFSRMTTDNRVVPASLAGLKPKRLPSASGGAQGALSVALVGLVNFRGPSTGIRQFWLSLLQLCARKRLVLCCSEVTDGLSLNTG